MDGWNKNLLFNNHPAFNEPLVPLGIFSKYTEIFSDGIYFGERKMSPYNPGELKDTLLTSFVREGVAKLLAEASMLLPAGYVFMTLDTYRRESSKNSF